MASDQGNRENVSRDDGAQRSARSGQRRRTSSGSSSTRRTSGTRRPSGQRSSASRERSADGRPSKQARAKRNATQRRAVADQQRVRTAKKRVRRRKKATLNIAALSQLPKPVLAGACALLLILVLLVHHSLRLGIMVNDEKVTVWRGTSVEKLLDKKVVEPSPGNLVAVDGSLITEGEGERCTATIDGTEVNDLKTKIHRGADLKITDGGDITEDFTTAKETIPHGKVDDSREFDAYWFGSIHLLSDGHDGTLAKRTGKLSGITVSEIEDPAVDSGYIIYTAKPDDKVIALTFDDGPWPETTDQILDILEENGAKATFFTIGEQISEYADPVRRANQLGCQVCTHTWDHAAGTGEGLSLAPMSSQEQIDEVQKGYKAIADVLGTEPAHIMRAPGGNFYGSVIDNLWPYVDAEIGWDVDTEDWRLPGSDAIAETIMSAQSGQVVLMHDGGGDRTQTVEALRIALPKLKEQGYQFVTVSELLAYGRPETSDSGDGVISVG